MNKLKRQVDSLDEGEMITLQHVRFSLPAPESHELEYQRVIGMLEMCVDDTIWIEEDEYACYVMDHWSWKRQFESMTSNYNSYGATGAFLDDNWKEEGTR